MGKVFDELAPRVMADLIRELGITPQQAAGIVGNFGQESGLISGRQEGTKEDSRPYPILGHTGGIDWPQWTGSRRKEFAAFVAEKGLEYPSYETSLAFVLHELRGKEAKALRQLLLTTTAKAAAETFEHFYERAGVKAWPQRVAYANRALKLWLASPFNTGEQPVPTPTPIPTPLPEPAKPWYMSQTLIGIAVAVLAPVVGKYFPPLGDQATLTSWIVWTLENVVPFVGGAIAVTGRLGATKPIAGTNAEKVAEAALEKAIEVPSPVYQPPLLPLEDEIADTVRGIRSDARIADLPLSVLVEQLPEAWEKIRELSESLSKPLKGE